MHLGRLVVGLSFLSLFTFGCSSSTPRTVAAPAKDAPREDLPKAAADGGDGAGMNLPGTSLAGGVCQTLPLSADSVDLYGKACAGSDGEGCTRLAAMYLCGVGVEKNGAVSASLVDKACKLGDVSGCMMLGAMLLDGEVVARDPRRAYAALDRACNALGNAHACGVYGTAVMLTGDVTERPRAVSLVQRACAQGDVDSCANLGVFYANGTGVAKDEGKAAELSRKACEGKNWASCSNLAAMYLVGYGPLAKDETKAAQLFELACNNDNALACVGLAKCYWDGAGVPAKPERALELLRESCDKGAGQACRLLADASGSRVAGPVPASKPGPFVF